MQKPRSTKWDGWTPERDAVLLRLWPTMTAREIAAEIGASRSAVLGRYHRLRGNGRQYQQTRRAKEQIVRDAKRQIKINALRDLERSLAKGVDRDTAILAASAAGATYRAIADVVGVSHQMIALIVTRPTTGRKATTKGSRAA